MHKRWVQRLSLIQREVVQLHHHRQLWKPTVAAIEERAPETPATFRNHYTKLYVDAQTMAIRRLVKSGHNDRRSLGRLLEDLVEHPDVMTRDRYVALHRENDADFLADDAGAFFDQEFGRPDGTLNPDRVKADRAQLDTAANVVSMVDENLAHIADPDDASMVGDRHITFGDVDQAIGRIGDVFRRYALLLTAASWLELEPVIQNDWKATLRRPLFDPDPLRDPPF